MKVKETMIKQKKRPLKLQIENFRYIFDAINVFVFLHFFHKTLVILPHIKDISIPTFLKIIKLKATQLKHSMSRK